MKMQKKTPEAQLAASKRYYDSKRGDEAWMAAKREQQRERVAARRDEYNARARERYAAGRLAALYADIAADEGEELADAWLAEMLRERQS